jgi:hypothetical protein
MSVTPFVGLGSNLEFASVLSPATFTSLAGFQSGAFSGDKVSTEKTTSMATANGVDTYISGTKEPGTFDAKCFYLPGETSQVALEAIRAAGSVVPFEIILPLSLGTVTFSGIVESMTRAFPLDKPATCDVKIKISGAVVVV